MSGSSVTGMVTYLDNGSLVVEQEKGGRSCVAVDLAEISPTLK